MKTNSGHLQFGDKGPQAEWPAERQIEWLLNVTDPIQQEWVFLGRWLYANVERDWEILSDMRKLTATVGETFRDLLEPWSDAWNHADVSVEPGAD